MGFFKEFRDFAVKGNVIDLAVGIVIGAAFGAIVTSLVNDIIMPPVGKMMNNIDFSNMFYPMDGKEYPSLKAAKDAGAPTINYGVFINAVINFVIVAFAIFVVIKQINRVKSAPPPPDASIKNCPFCDTSISVKASRCPHCTSQL